MGYFQTSLDVSNYLAQGLSLSTSKQAFEEIDAVQVFDGRTQELIALRDLLIQQETKFFNDILGTSSGNPEQDLKLLQSKIDDWNNSGARNMILNNQNIILDILKLFGGIDLEDVAKAFTDRLVTEQLVKKMYEEEHLPEITEDLTEQLRLFLNKNFKMSFGKGQFQKKVTLIDNGKGEYHIEFSGEMGGDYKNRFAQIFFEIGKNENDYLEKKNALTFVNPYATDKGALRQGVIEILTRQGISGTPLIYITKELNKNFGEYALAKNFAVTKGFLGEVYWNAFFQFLSNGRLAVAPTGTVKNLGGQSIPIDMVVKDFGFQIKAYNLHNGKVNLGLKGDVQRGVGTFIVDRVQMSASDALLMFFGAWGYNQPVEDASSSYVSLYNSFENSFDTINKVFQLHVDKIIGLDKQFQARIDAEAENALAQEVFKEDRVYYNTFFLISDKMVPSSAIVQGIIESFEKEDARVRFEAQYSKKYSQPNDKEKLWAHTPPSSLVKAANYATIHYEVLIDVIEILNNVYNYIEN